jgi:hypothetical protein
VGGVRGGTEVPTGRGGIRSVGTLPACDILPAQRIRPGRPLQGPVRCPRSAIDAARSAPSGRVPRSAGSQYPHRRRQDAPALPHWRQGRGVDASAVCRASASTGPRFRRTWSLRRWAGVLQTRDMSMCALQRPPHAERRRRKGAMQFDDAQRWNRDASWRRRSALGRSLRRTQPCWRSG